MRVDADLIERAVILAAHMVRTLLHRAMDVRILFIVHGKCSFRHSVFAVQDDYDHSERNYTSRKENTYLRNFYVILKEIQIMSNMREIKRIQEKTTEILLKTGIFVSLC